MKTIFISGQFNVLHPGHLRLFRFAKEYGDRLVVGVNSDRVAGESAHINEKYRLEGVESIGLVDEAFIINEPIDAVIRRVRPDFVIKGKEHEQLYNIEKITLEEYGGRLIFTSGESAFSSVDLIRKEFFTSDRAPFRKSDDYINRHVISIERLVNFVNKFSDIKTLVIGDLIVDEYINCEPLGMSQEETTIVVSPIDSNKYIGGSGIVAAHAAGLNSNAQLISVVGDDLAAEFARIELEKFGVPNTLFLDGGRPTTLKQRYRSNGKSLLRVSHLHQGSISIELQDMIFSAVCKKIKEIDLLVLSDFNYGCLPQGLVDRLIQLAKNNHVLVSADSQSSSQMGNVARFLGVDLLTPTEHEARVSLQNNEDGLVVLVEKLRLKSEAKNILLKLGADGVIVCPAPTLQTKDLVTDRIYALNPIPKDVAGAGDSLLITASLAMASDLNLWEAAFLGSVAAAIQVSRVGNEPIRSNELLKELVGV